MDGIENENNERWNGPQKQREPSRVETHNHTLAECQNIVPLFFDKIFFSVVFLYKFLALHILGKQALQ